MDRSATAPGARTVLCVNAGSSSLKFSLHPLDAAGQPLAATLQGQASALEPGGQPRLHYRGPTGQATLLCPQGGAPAMASPGALAASQGHHWALHALLALLQEHGAATGLCAIAHRVVHGGSQFSASVRVDDTVLHALQPLCALAPLHQPHNLAALQRMAEVFAGVPQVACFDTAYHHSLPGPQARFALPPAVQALGVRRYGFHGLSYQGVMATLQQHSARAGQRVLMAHLGNGASLCAALQGRSVATTMGFTALDGLVMGTRCGALDPGVLLYLLEQGWDHAALQRLLYEESGLLGLSGLSADMRTLRASARPEAAQAIAHFTHSVLREAGAMVAALQGLDVLSFSGGIGENDAALRHSVCQQLHWLGLVLDDEANQAATPDAVCALHHRSSRVEVWLVPSDESQVMAIEACQVLGIADKNRC
ncbi:MAG: acetate/propionate family kinase [Rhodoferax sp.]